MILNLKTVIDERQKGVPIENRKRNLKKNKFFTFERGKRNMNSLSPISRRERDISKYFYQFLEEGE